MANKKMANKKNGTKTAASKPAETFIVNRLGKSLDQGARKAVAAQSKGKK